MWQWRREPEIPHFYPGRSLALTRIGQEISWSGKLLDDSAAVDLTLCSSQPGVKLGNESLTSTVISPSSLLCDWKIWKGVKNWTHLNQYNRMENWRYFLSCSLSIPPSATIIYASWSSFFLLGEGNFINCMEMAYEVSHHIATSESQDGGKNCANDFLRWCALCRVSVHVDLGQ